MEAELQRHARATVLRFERCPERFIGAVLEHRVGIGAFDPRCVAHEQIEVHGNDAALRRTFRDLRQREARRIAGSIRHRGAFRNAAGIVAEAAFVERRIEPGIGRKVRRPETCDGLFRERAPAVRFTRDVVDLVSVAQDGGEGVEFCKPVLLGPVLAVVVPAAMAGDLVAFGMRQPDLPEPGGHFLFRLGKAHVGFTGRLAGRLIVAAGVRRQQEHAGQEIGKRPAGLLRQHAAAFPLREVMRAIEGDDHILLGQHPGTGHAGGAEGEQSGKRRTDAESNRHRQGSNAGSLINRNR